MLYGVVVFRSNLIYYSLPGHGTWSMLPLLRPVLYPRVCRLRPPQSKFRGYTRWHPCLSCSLMFFHLFMEPAFFNLNLEARQIVSAGDQQGLVAFLALLKSWIGTLGLGQEHCCPFCLRWSHQTSQNENEWPVEHASGWWGEKLK